MTSTMKITCKGVISPMSKRRKSKAIIPIFRIRRIYIICKRI